MEADELKEDNCDIGSRVVPAESYVTSDVSTPVKIRMKESGASSAAPVTVPALLASTTRRWPNRKAMCMKRENRWIDWTYSEYFEQSRTAARAFIALGLQPFDGVALMGFNSPEYFIANMGAIMAGGVTTGMYTTSTENTCQFYLSNTRVLIAIVENDKYCSKVSNVRQNCANLTTIVQYSGEPQQQGVLSWQDFMAKAEEYDEQILEDRIRSLAANHCASIIYTSGTTGNPKGVMVSHDMYTWMAVEGGRYAGLTQDYDVIVSYLPLSHGAAQIVDIYAAMAVGATVCFAQPDALKGSLLETLKEVQPTIMFGVPRIWEKIHERLTRVFSEGGLKISLLNWCRQRAINYWRAKEKDPKTSSGIQFYVIDCLLAKVRQQLGLGRVRAGVTAAAPISQEVVEFMLSLNIPIMEMYGLSETGGPTTMNLHSAFRLGSVGRAFVDSEIKVDQSTTDDRGGGELLYRGRNMMMGYLNRPEATAEAIDEDGWYHTGDLGRIDAEGFVYITGRLKELLITAGGKNIAPVPLEDNIKASLVPLVSNVIVIGDRKKFLAALLAVKVEVDVETGEPSDTLTADSCAWLEKRGVPVKTLPELMQDIGKIKDDIQQGIDLANSKAESTACSVREWRILPKDFSLAGGELGPTMKLRRNIVTSRYKDIIDEIYG